ncbi:MAG TPA: RNA polymerase sigma factor [Solirubrobacteraceae bacterium]|jgi:RNA polymerase sigma factor (sigma-70 family)|nr:RNA polymerase sigma factor [Solirubrobacteraceae bacterium]
MDADIPKPGHSLQQAKPVLPGRLLGDERLAREAGAGSERAFTTLFQRYHQQLYRYCRGLTGSDQDGQDALQTTFTKALIAMREGRRNAPLRPWLYRIAHNESISLIRARNSALAADLPLELEAAQAVVDTVEERERMAMLVVDLRELPEQQRGALVMRELSGLSHEEIAEVLQVSVGAAKQSILEARRSLMEFVEGRAMTCDEIQRIVSDDDRRSLRSRRVRAHMRDCASCSAFAAAIPRRRAEMLALWPVLPAAGSAGLLAKITGGAGSGHGGGGAGLLAGTAAKGVGATISIKAAAAAGAAVVATATVGAVAVLHHSPTQRPLASSPGAVVSHSASGHGSAAVHTPFTVFQASANHHGVTGKEFGTRTGTHAAGQGSHANGQTPNGHGGGLAAAPGQTGQHGHSATTSTSSSTHGQSQTPHGGPSRRNPTVTKRPVSTKVTHRRVTHRAHKPRRHTLRTPTKTTAAGRTKTAAASQTKTTSRTTTTTVVTTTTFTVTTTTVTSSGSSASGGHVNAGTALGQSSSSASGKSSN